MVLVLWSVERYLSLRTAVTSYSFKDITSIIDNTIQRLGAAFFDTNATGNLEFLKSTVGVYQSYVDEKTEKEYLQCGS